MPTTYSRILKIHSLYQKKSVSCTELTSMYLDAVKKENKILNAYITVTREKALAQAKRVDHLLARGEELPMLAGIPMALKDNISTRDIRTTCGSKMLRNYLPVYDAFVWKTLAGRHAVLLGKTNLDEFAMGSTGESSYFGTVSNPHDTSRVAGGSSSGTAAAVCAGLAAYGLGSDTGGSLRQPAAFCGVVGLKPTYGAVSRCGLVAHASGMDQIGPIAYSVRDAALVFDAICAPDPQDATCRGGRGDCARRLGESIRGARIAMPRELFDGITTEVSQALGKAAKIYRKLGATVEEISLPGLLYVLPVYYILSSAEASSNLGRFDGIRYGHQAGHYESVEEGIRKTRSEGFGKEVRRRILLGTYVLSAGYYDAYYKKAQNMQGMIRREMEEALTKYDFLLTPAASCAAFYKNQMNNAVQTYQTDLCTVPANLAGLPAISLPCGMDPDGMPLGMQLIGRAFGETYLLNAAYAFEQETEGQYLDTLDRGVTL